MLVSFDPSNQQLFEFNKFIYNLFLSFFFFFFFIIIIYSCTILLLGVSANIFLKLNYNVVIKKKRENWKKNRSAES
jgi:hypothetical protein